MSKGAQTVRDCQIIEKTKGLLVNAQTNQEFKYSDACVQVGPHTGIDESATQKAAQQIDATLLQLFK